MGQTLSSPIVDKHSSAGHDKRFAYGASAMQGWRISITNRVKPFSSLLRISLLVHVIVVFALLCMHHVLVLPFRICSWRSNFFCALLMLVLLHVFPTLQTYHPYRPPSYIILDSSPCMFCLLFFSISCLVLLK